MRYGRVGELGGALSARLQGDRPDVRVMVPATRAPFVLLQLRQVISATTLGLDHVFYPGHRKHAIDRPIFIIGNPRSGTTFLHRLLLGAGDMAALELWEMMFPAITARKLLGGIVPTTGQAVTGPLPPVRCARNQPARYRDRRRSLVLPDHGRPLRVGVFPCLARHLGKWLVTARIRDRRRDAARGRHASSTITTHAGDGT